MLKRPKPKTISMEDMRQISQAQNYTSGQRVGKSYDPNFPAFDVPVNQKLLVYVPNHRVESETGVELRMDKCVRHSIKSGRTYGSARCINGLQIDALGYTGECPLCESSSENWDLYNKDYAALCAAHGVEVGSAEADAQLKDKRKDLLDAKAIGGPELFYTYPIVVIECIEENGVLTTKPKLDANGGVVGKPCFFTTKDTTFESKWVKALDALDDDDTCFAGKWLVLNYTTTAANPTKMNSAKDMVVTVKLMGDSYNAVAAHFDKVTEEFTPEKAQEVIVTNIIRDFDETQEVVDMAMKHTRERLAQLSVAPVVASQPVQAPTGNANAVLSQFGAAPVPVDTVAVGAVPPAQINADVPEGADGDVPFN